MGRAEYRRAERESIKAKTKTYNFTQEQLEQVIKEGAEKELKRVYEQAFNDATNTAMILTLTLPLKVLMDHYWKKSYAKRIPEFTAHVLEYYRRWQDGEIEIEDLKADLWEYAGMRLEESEE